MEQCQVPALHAGSLDRWVGRRGGGGGRGGVHKTAGISMHKTAIYRNFCLYNL